MRYDIALYLRLIRILIHSQLTYRVSFLLDVLATSLITVMNFATLAFIFQRFGNIAGWTLGEVAFLYGMVETAFGTMDLLFSGFDPDSFGRFIRLGRLDQLMLRPASITIQVLGSNFVMRRLGRILQGLAVLVISMSLVQFHWTFLKAIYLPFVFASQVCFFGGLFIIGATITFWTIESIEVVNIFTYGGSEMMSYPMNIYQDWMRRFFTYIIPAIFLNYYPALFLLDKPDPLNMPAIAPFIAPVVGFGFLVIGLVFWQFGLRHYQSAGT